MTDILLLIVSAIVGFAVGVFFFLGLLWTIRRGIASTRPAVWFLLSLVIRTSITLAVFYFVALGHWLRLVLCLCGFIVARFVVVRWGKTQDDNRKEVRIAP
jgi:F1F0 ATPase subunit 2